MTLLFQIAAAAAAVGAASPSQPPRPFDALHYDFTMTLADDSVPLHMHANATIVRVAPASSLHLDLVGLRATSVQLNGARATWRQDSTGIVIEIPAAARDTLRVSVDYEGAPRDGLVITRDAQRRLRAFGDNWPTRARYWLASIDDPADKATVSFHVTAPRYATVIANGMQDSVTDLAGARRATSWHEAQPIPTYLMVVAVAAMDSIDLGNAACGHAEMGRCVHERAFAFPDSRDRLPGPFAHATDIVSWFSELIAPFPFEKLDHLQSSTRFGGMENASAIFYSDEELRNGTLGESTVAHETAHQWFGDAVTEARFADLWLSEGFATYFAALWTEHHAGEEPFRAEMRKTRDQIVQAPEVWSKPVVDTVESDYMRLLNRNSYQKGGWTLHMLRDVVGDSAFFRGIRAYYVAHHDGNARTDDLQRAMEQSSGQSLGWFFDEWLKQPGVPRLKVSWRWNAATRDATVRVAREGKYRMPLTIALRDDDGRETRAHTVIDSDTTAITVHMEHEPKSVIADPDVKLLADIRVETP